MKAWLLLAFAAALQAAPPVLQELIPRGAQRGSTFTLYLRGDGLVQGARVETSLPGTFSRLTLSRDPQARFAMARPNTVLPFLVSLRPDAPAGVYPLRVVAPDGISSVLLFSVGAYPEVDEAESRDPRQANDFPAEAQKISVPVVINGTLSGADVDNYSFTAKAGQKLVFEVEARRAGSAIDPAIEVFDATGKEIARNDDAPGLGVDARLEATFAKAGEYRVQVHDSKYSEQAENFYRLQIGSYEYAEGLFPLGWRRGGNTEVALVGGNLPQAVRVKADLAGRAEFVPVALPGSPALPLRFVLSDRQELLEPAGGSVVDLPANAVMNGRIAKPGEVDRYRLRVEPGQHWVFEVAAASLGTSRLDGLLTVFDGAGKKLASADDGNGLDPVLPFEVPKEVHEVVLALEDVLGRGGESFAYRLEARRARPDFVANLATPYVNVPVGGTAQVVVNIQRRGYDGEIRIRIPNLPGGFHAAGGHVPSEAAAQSFNNDNAGHRSARSVLTITADPDVKPQRLDLAVVAEAQTPDGPMRREARGPGIVTVVRGDRQKPFTAPWLGIGLPLATTSPLPVKLAAGPPVAHFAQGFELNLEYQISRGVAARTSEVRVRQEIAGAVGNLRILKGLENKGGDRGSFLVNTNFATPFTTFDMVLTADAVIDGKPLTVTAPAVEVEVAPGYEIALGSPTLQVTPGGRAQVRGRLRREPTFEGGVVRVRAEDLPDGVTCPAVEVAADQKEFVLSCAAGAAVRPGAYPIRIASVAPDTGRKAKQDYKIPDLNARLVVAGTTQASR
ncbi:MAG TPA: PPC domain-containing protein [Bryobacteraceae bacterium]|nr:PPC domain-containing protein [Bryobacteraceae bacterium]